MTKPLRLIHYVEFRAFQTKPNLSYPDLPSWPTVFYNSDFNKGSFAILAIFFWFFRLDFFVWQARWARPAFEFCFHLLLLFGCLGYFWLPRIFFGFYFKVSCFSHFVFFVYIFVSFCVTDQILFLSDFLPSTLRYHLSKLQHKSMYICKCIQVYNSVQVYKSIQANVDVCHLEL